MIETTKLGLVTVLYNGIEVLDGFYESLKIQKFKNFILYVIDNSPNDIAIDKSKELSYKFNIDTVFINNNENLGVAKGNNQGIELARKDGCDFVLILNNDIEFDENVIYNMLSYSIDKKEYVIVPKIFFHGTELLWYGGGKIHDYSGVTTHFGYMKNDNSSYSQINYQNYSPTCFMLVKSHVFDSVGLMDEKYFVYYDDTDFVYRMNKNGYKICYYPNSIVYHKVSTTTGGYNTEFAMYYANRNRFYFIVKNYKGLKKSISLFVFLSTRLLKLLTIDKSKRVKLIRGVLDAISMFNN